MCKIISKTWFWKWIKKFKSFKLLYFHNFSWAKLQCLITMTEVGIMGQRSFQVNRSIRLITRPGPLVVIFENLSNTLWIFEWLQLLVIKIYYLHSQIIFSNIKSRNKLKISAPQLNQTWPYIPNSVCNWYFLWPWL